MDLLIKESNWSGFCNSVLLLPAWAKPDNKLLYDCIIIFPPEVVPFSSQAFSVSHSTATVNRVGVDKKLGGNITGIADPNWHKAYSMPHNITLSNKSRGDWLGIGLLVGGEWLPLHHSVSFSFLHFIECLYLIPWLFLISALPILSQSHWGGMSERLVGPYLLTRVSPPQFKIKTSDKRPVTSLCEVQVLKHLWEERDS